MADDRPPVDDELVARIAGGDREAFALLYRRYRTDVYRFAAHVSGSPAVADDVVQDVFVAVIEDASIIERSVRRSAVVARDRLQSRRDGGACVRAASGRWHRPPGLAVRDLLGVIGSGTFALRALLS
jgi:hypothetical protein